MTSFIAWIGVDPGPSTGIVVLLWDAENRCWEIRAFQCNADAVDELLWWLLTHFTPVTVAIEKFTTSNKAGSKGAQAEITRMLATLVRVRCAEAGVKLVERRATDVTEWASDKRLSRIGFPMGLKFKDARWACRHALFAAVTHDRTLDPLLLNYLPSVHWVKKADYRKARHADDNPGYRDRCLHADRSAHQLPGLPGNPQRAHRQQEQEHAQDSHPGRRVRPGSAGYAD